MPLLPVDVVARCIHRGVREDEFDPPDEYGPTGIDKAAVDARQRLGDGQAAEVVKRDTDPVGHDEAGEEAVVGKEHAGVQGVLVHAAAVFAGEIVDRREDNGDHHKGTEAALASDDELGGELTFLEELRNEA